MILKKDLAHMTIKEIEEMVSTCKPSLELLNILKNDSRQGVRRLVQKLEKMLARQAYLEERFESMMEYEKAYWGQGIKYIAGIDEAGRGPLAGPVVAAAVIIQPDFFLPGLNDSKQLTCKERKDFYNYIMKNALCVGVGIVDNEEIDKINILNASFKAMSLALADLMKRGCEPDFIFVDGDKPIPGIVTFQLPIVKGDGASVSIAAASVVAKVTRDRIMEQYNQKYPGYGFANNKGYGSAEHITGLRKLGPSPIHRRSFSIVKEIACSLE